MPRKVHLDVPDDALTSPGRALSDRAHWENRLMPVIEELMEEYLEYVRREVTSTLRADSGFIHDAYEEIVVAGVLDSLEGEIAGAYEEVSAFMKASDTPDALYDSIEAVIEEAPKAQQATLLREVLSMEGQQLQRVPDEDSESLSASLGTALVGIRALAKRGPRWASKAASTARSVATATRGVVVQNKIHQAGQHHKRWITRRDHRVRNTHAMADGQTVPLNSHFQVGAASLLVPGDRRGPLDETINCRCTVVGADGPDSDDYSALDDMEDEDFQP